MLICLIPSPADEHPSGANQMRQHLSFREHFRRGNARSYPARRATRSLFDQMGKFTGSLQLGDLLADLASRPTHETGDLLDWIIPCASTSFAGYHFPDLAFS